MDVEPEIIAPVGIDAFSAYLRNGHVVDIDLEASNILPGSDLTTGAQLDALRYEANTLDAAPRFHFDMVVLQPRLLWKAYFNGDGTMLYIPLATGLDMKLLFEFDVGNTAWTQKSSRMGLTIDLASAWRAAFNVRIE